MPKNCLNCGVELDGHPRRKYCPRPECQRVRIRKSRLMKAAQVTRSCRICGQPVEGRRRYCTDPACRKIRHARAVMDWRHRKGISTRYNRTLY